MAILPLFIFFYCCFSVISGVGPDPPSHLPIGADPQFLSLIVLIVPDTVANTTKTEVGSIILFKIEKKLFKLKRKSCKRLNKQ